MKVEYSNNKPSIPSGYRALNIGDIIQTGDLFYNQFCMIWDIAPYIGREYNKDFVIFIRKLE